MAKTILLPADIKSRADKIIEAKTNGDYDRPFTIHGASGKEYHYKGDFFYSDISFAVNLEFPKNTMIHKRYSNEIFTYIVDTLEEEGYKIHS